MWNMTKTLDDYLKDPDLANEPAILREIHAIRLMIQDETKGMTISERTAYYNESTIGNVYSAEKNNEN